MTTATARLAAWQNQERWRGDELQLLRVPQSVPEMGRLCYSSLTCCIASVTLPRPRYPSLRNGDSNGTSYLKVLEKINQHFQQCLAYTSTHQVPAIIIYCPRFTQEELILKGKPDRHNLEFTPATSLKGRASKGKCLAKQTSGAPPGSSHPLPHLAQSTKRRLACLPPGASLWGRAASPAGTSLVKCPLQNLRSTDSVAENPKACKGGL